MKKYNPIHIIIWRCLCFCPYCVGMFICVSMRFLMYGYQDAKECYKDLM